MSASYLMISATGFCKKAEAAQPIWAARTSLLLNGSDERPAPSGQVRRPLAWLSTPSRERVDWAASTPRTAKIMISTWIQRTLFPTVCTSFEDNPH